MPFLWTAKLLIRGLLQTARYKSLMRRSCSRNSPPLFASRGKCWFCEANSRLRTAVLRKNLLIRKKIRLGTVLEMLLVVLLVQSLHFFTANMDLAGLVHQSVLDYRSSVDSGAWAVGSKRKVGWTEGSLFMSSLYAVRRLLHQWGSTVPLSVKKVTFQNKSKPELIFNQTSSYFNFLLHWRKKW